MRSLALVVLVATTTGGCYVGRTPAAKRANYVLNGAAIVMGAIVIAGGASTGSACSNPDVSCVGGIGDSLATLIGGAVIGGGAIGIGASAIVPTKRVQESAPIEPTVNVTGPGLKPATVTLR